MLEGLSPEGLLDGVLGGSGADWEPPEAAEVEAWFSGYAGFAFIDRGSMGSVYAATQLSLDRRVAIKVLPPELGLNPDFLARFKREAKLLAKLQHPNIVAIHDTGTTENGHAYIVMEYIQGTSLLDIMRERSIPLNEALQITAQVLQALDFAHQHRVIHRDIKPTNILIDEWGRARVADFGLAKLIGQNWFDSDALRGTSLGLGTPGYTAPEQRRSDPKIDQRTDLFSLGITLRELITENLSDDPDDLSDLAEAKCPRFVTAIILKSIQEEPHKRFQTAAEMGTAIQKALQRLASPPLPAQILQKPITAAVIGIQLVVTTLLLSERLQEKGWFSAPSNPTSNATLPTLLPIEGTPFLVLAQSLPMAQALLRIDQIPDAHLAQLDPENEDLLKEQLIAMGIVTPLWVQSARDGTPTLFSADASATPPPSDAAVEAWSLLSREIEPAP